MGLVTTSRITHATPAAAYAHSVDRNWESTKNIANDGKAKGCKDIASQLIDNGDIDVRNYSPSNLQGSYLSNNLSHTKYLSLLKKNFTILT